MINVSLQMRNDAVSSKLMKMVTKFPLINYCRREARIGDTWGVEEDVNYRKMLSQ